MNDIYLGFDTGGTKCSVVAGDATFSVLQKVGFDMNTDFLLTLYQELNTKR
jgi:hypothetical protein